jgi:putative transposase
MARLPRLSVAGHVHLAMQRGHHGLSVFQDEADYRGYLACLQAALPQHGVLLHAYALLPDRVLLLLTPQSDDSLARLLQTLGRRFGAAYNRRHRRSGTLWEGRFRSTVVEAATWLLDCIRYVETTPVSQMLDADVLGYEWSSAAHHAGRRVDPLISEHSAYWRLGNTPFEREARYRALLSEALPLDVSRRIADACVKGWALGSGDFLRQLEQLVKRPTLPRRPGRPPAGLKPNHKGVPN